MAPRLPIYVKILLWFFANLLVLVAVFLALVRAQFELRPDVLLPGTAHQRIEVLTDLILAELGERPRGEWNSVLQRFSRIHGLDFALYHADGALWAGEPEPLPGEVRTRLMEPRPLLRPADLPRVPLPAPERPRAIRRDDAGLEPQPLGPVQDEESPRTSPRLRPAPGARRDSVPLRSPDRLLPPPPGSRPKLLVRTSNPTRYWLLVRAALREGQAGRPTPVTLVLASESLSGGGLFFDLKPWWMAGIGALVFSALFWFPLVRGITRSLSQMTHATRQIAQGHFDVRVDERRRDELGSLGRSINQMAARLHGFVTGQKRFLGDVAHELCSPLARLQTALGILEQRADDKQSPYVRVACDKATHMAQLVNELLSFSKASLTTGPPKLQPVSLRESVEAAVQREQGDDAPIVVEVPQGLRAQADPDLLVRSLANLLRNAIRYAGHAGPITIRAEQHDAEVSISIADSGPGVPEDELARILDPFYRLDVSRDRATGGMGLGLAIVKTCVESCGGTVICRNRQPHGLEVILNLRAA